MLGNNRVITTIAVNDLENAVIFYCEILGLEQESSNFAGVVLKSGDGRIGLHESAAAGSSLATRAWWTVDDVSKTVTTLKAKGIAFEKNYDLPHTTRKDEIYHLSDTARAAWFKDPDGNVLGFGNF